MSSNLQDPLEAGKSAVVELHAKWKAADERAGAKRLPDISIFMVPLLAILFWSTPWEGDPRTAPVIKRLFQLKASQWSWDQAEFRSMLESVDPNELVDGAPLFVRLGIEGHDEELLQKLVARGASLNGSDWGCSPLLAALEADDKAVDSKVESYSRSEKVIPKLTKILLRAGADPKQAPTAASINRRIATKYPSGICAQFDERLKGGESFLAIALDTSKDDELLRLLVEAGLSPRDKQEAELVLARLRYRRSAEAETLRDRCLKAGGAVDAGFYGSALVATIDNTRHSTAAERMTAVAGMLKKGADPNAKGGWRGKLPLEEAIDTCTGVGNQFLWASQLSATDANSYMSAHYAQSWRENNAAARKNNGATRDIILLLLDSGADPNRRRPADGDSSESILTQAVRGCPSDVAELLVSKGAIVDKAAVNAAFYDLKAFLQARLPSH